MIDFSYLLSSLILLAIWLVGMSLFPRERKRIVIASFLSMPGAVYALLFVPEYWNPQKITAFAIGFEDLIFSFATGGIAWLMISQTAGRNYSSSLIFGTAIKRYLGIKVLGLFLAFVLLRSTGRGVMAEALIGMAIVSLIILVRLRFKVWEIAAAGSSLFTLFYFIYCAAVLNLFPNMRGFWHKQTVWGTSIFIVPLGEIVWAFAFGAIWSLILAYVFDLKRAPRDQKT